METKDLRWTFMLKKPVLALLELKDSKKIPSEISKKIDCTYTHVLKILNDFHRYGLVEFKKEGRIKEVRLTERGIEIAHDLEGLSRRLENIEHDTGQK